jgi:integrase
VPASRMKAGREHRVPLTPRALAILERLKEVQTGEHVFPGQRRGKPLSEMALAMVLRRLKVKNATVHGFRSAFPKCPSPVLLQKPGSPMRSAT